MHDRDEEQRWSRRVPRLVKLSFGYCIYVLNLKPVKRNKSVPCHCKREKFYHVSCVSHGSFGRAAICSPSHYWAVFSSSAPGTRLLLLTQAGPILFNHVTSKTCRTSELVQTLQGILFSVSTLCLELLIKSVGYKT